MAKISTNTGWYYCLLGKNPFLMYTSKYLEIYYWKIKDSFVRTHLFLLIQFREQTLCCL